MTVIEHDFPPDVPVVVTVDASEPPATAADTLSLLEEGVELVRKGDTTSGNAKIQQALTLAERAQADRVTVRPLNDAELAQRELDRADGAERAAAADADEAETAALIAKLSAGKASPAEMQGAVARLLGAQTP